MFAGHRKGKSPYKLEVRLDPAVRSGLKFCSQMENGRSEFDKAGGAGDGGGVCHTAPKFRAGPQGWEKFRQLSFPEYFPLPFISDQQPESKQTKNTANFSQHS